MPATKRTKPLYQRGTYALYRRAGRQNLEIVWYDHDRKRERSVSAGTADLGAARLALDRLYLAGQGARICPHCHRPMESDGSPLLSAAIADYLILSEAKAGLKSARSRLGHVIDYLAATDATVTCAGADEAWIGRFRAWLAARPVTNKAGAPIRARSLAHIEGCVMQLAAAINATPGQRAGFRAEQQKAVAASPTYRADVKMLAAMFRFALAKPERINLLRYLRAAVATWARPDAIFDITARQWHGAAGVLDLNPPGRRQTKKHRPRIPIARQFAPFLDAMADNYLPVTLVRSSWEKMRTELNLPGEREAGIKVVRRSMATLARKRIGEANWRQGEMMLGHVKMSVSDIYALPDPANLGLALAATEAIIAEIEALAPGAFYRTVTANGTPLQVIEGGVSS